MLWWLWRHIHLPEVEPILMMWFCNSVHIHILSALNWVVIFEWEGQSITQACSAIVSDICRRVSLATSIPAWIIIPGGAAPNSGWYSIAKAAGGHCCECIFIKNAAERPIYTKRKGYGSSLLFYQKGQFTQKVYMVDCWSLPAIPSVNLFLKASLLSFHCWRSVIWKLYSWKSKEEKFIKCSSTTIYYTTLLILQKPWILYTKVYIIYRSDS